MFWSTMARMILLCRLRALSDGWKNSILMMLLNSGMDYLMLRDTLFSVWKTNDRTSGYFKQAGFLELKTVNNAGHLVPMDQG